MLTILHLRCSVPDLCRATAHFGCNSPYNRVLQQQRCLPFEQGCAVWRSQGGICCHMDALGLAPLQHGLIPEVWVALDLQPAMHIGATLCPCQSSAPQGSELYSVETCDYRRNTSVASTPVYYECLHVAVRTNICSEAEAEAQQPAKCTSHNLFSPYSVMHCMSIGLQKSST